MACEYSFDGGKTYISKEEFIKKLAEGKLDEFINQGIVKLGNIRNGKAELNEEQEVKQVAEKTGISPKNLKDLYDINRKLFGLDRLKSLAAAITMDRMIGVMAKRANVSKAEMYGRLNFEKSSKGELGGKNVLWQGSSALSNFEAWKGSNELLSGADIKDAKTGQPIVVRGYHGTTNEFYEFDSSVKGNVEGHLGKVNYFTSDYQDAANNYQAEGADLTGRIDRRSDEIENKLTYDYSDDLNGVDLDKVKKDWGLSDSEIDSIYPNGIPDVIEPNELSYFLAEKELKGGSERVLDVFVKLNNPVVLGNGSTWFETLNISERDLEQAAQEIADENDISIKEAKRDYEYEIRDRAIENSGYENLASEALSDALRSNGYDGSKANEILGDNIYETEIDLNKLEKDLRKADLYENEYGELASSQVIADFFKNLGFDGIILTDVSNRFKGMNLGGSTSHIHVFDEFANQIKLADGSNTSFGETRDIRFQKDKGKAQGAVMVSMDGQATIYALTDPNVSTPVHELAHVFEHYLTPEERQEVIKSTGTQGWTIETSERFARGFERYLANGDAPTEGLKKVFQKFKQWLTEIYNGIKDSEIDIELNPKMEEIYAKMLGEDVVKKKKQPPTPPPPTEKKGEGEESRKDRFEIKSILNRIANSENISEDIREKFKSNLKYKVSSQAQAREVAKAIISEFGYKDALVMAEAGRFDGDVNSFIFAESLDNAFENESKAKTPEEKAKFAEEWKDIAIRYDEAARDKGRFISAIQDFYKKSPLGIVMVEESKRGDQFRKWFEGREKPFREVFEELVKEPEFEELLDKKVQENLKKERGEVRAKRRTKIENFFDSAKFKGDALYAVPIPPKVINAALDLMKNSFLAGESVVNAVEVAIEYISKEVGQWDKEKFRKEYQEKLQSLDGAKTTKTEEELTQEKKEKILDKFRKKLKGLSESQKEEVIRKAFKKLVENGALEYDDFKDIIADVLGYGKLSDAEIAKITELVNDINEVDKLGEQIRKEENRSIENLRKYKEAKKKAEKSATQLAALVYNKPDILKRLLSIMQLNTLGIPSLVNNPLFNIFNQSTVRFPIGLQLSVLDQIIYGASKVGNKLFGTDVLLPENNIFTSQGEFFRKLGQGASESGSQLINGLTSRDYFQKEVYASQIQPFTSAKDLWDWKFKGKKLTPAQLADKSLQATVGLPAEVVARFLNIGDKPQRYAAEGAKAAVLSKKFGLSDVDYEYFLEFPKEEAYRAYKEQGLSDEAAMEKAEKTKEAIVKAGEESVFQQDNFLNDAINAAFEASKKFGNISYGFAQAVKMLNFPYLKIPLNAFWSVYNLVNPEIAFTQSAYYGLKAIKTKDKADIQKAKMWAAHGTTGMALLAIASGLVAKGIINADNDDETTKKERMGEKQYEQQKSLNISKLNAILQGQDPDKVENGLNVDLKYFGNIGNILNTVAIRQENMTPEQRANSAEYMNELFSNLRQSSLELIDNGVFSNASALVKSFDRGGVYLDNYLLNLINMGTNIIQPAMFAQMSRAQLPYYSKVKADNFYDELKNNLLARSSLVRELTGKYPPSQIGIWGDKLERKDDFLLKWFGMSRVNKDNFAQPIYEDYKKTKNTEFLPPSVKPLIDKNKLTVKEAEALEVLVGNARKSLIKPYVNDMAKVEGYEQKYSDLTESQKLKVLKKIYLEGFKMGKNDFINAYPKFGKPESQFPTDAEIDEQIKEALFELSVDLKVLDKNSPKK